MVVPWPLLSPSCARRGAGSASPSTTCGSPLAREARENVGTLPYTASEMAAGDGAAFGVATDVDQLGGLLHELLVGEPPHPGSDLTQVLHHAYLSPPPDYPESVPKELARLATRALDRDPKRRPKDAEEFRVALDAWCVHRASIELVDESTRRARLAKGLVELGQDPSPAWRDTRFGYLQALRIWPENERRSAPPSPSNRPAPRGGRPSTPRRGPSATSAPRALAGSSLGASSPGSRSPWSERRERAHVAVHHERTGDTAGSPISTRNY